MAIQHFYSQTVADGTATSVVRPSDWNSNHKVVYALSGNTLGSSQISGADVTLVGGSNITLSADTANSRLNIVGNTVQDFWSLQGNTAGTNVYSWTNDGLYLYGGNNITLSGNGSTITISGANGGGGGDTRQYFDNLGPLATASGAMGGKAIQYRTLWFAPLEPFNDKFDADMTMNTLAIDLSLSGSTATMSVPFSSTVRIGIYTINSTAASLSMGLLNSVQATFGFAAGATNNSTAFAGQRYLTIHSSQWSSQPVLTNGGRYIVGMVWDSSSTSQNVAQSVLGGFMNSTAARSGYIGASGTTATWQGAGQFLGHYSATTQSLPAGVAYSQVNKQAASANFIPHLIAFNYTNVTL